MFIILNFVSIALIIFSREKINKLDEQMEGDAHSNVFIVGERKGGREEDILEIKSNYN